MNINRLHPPPEQGFTLTEALVTVAIVSILSSIAVPSFTSHIDRQELMGAQQEVEEVALLCSEQKLYGGLYKIPETVGSTSLSGDCSTINATHEHGTFTIEISDDGDINRSYSS